MIEIVFGDSACGSLKAAQRFGEGNFHAGSIGIIIRHEDGREAAAEELEAARSEAEERIRLAWERGRPLGGSAADVFGFGHALSVGDISEERPGEKRERALRLLFGAFPDGEEKRLAGEILKRVNVNLNKVRERVLSGEPMRIWYSSQPDEMCGLCWFMAQLERWGAQDCEVTLVKLPEWETDETDNIVWRNGWGEVHPGEWHRYLALQRPAPQGFVRSCAAHWRQLQAENAPLRAVLNGQLVSVPEGIYDSFIAREIAAEDREFNEAKVIGRVLGKYRLGIGDGWIAIRIEGMIKDGTLEVVSEAGKNMPSYHRVLRKLQ